ncbi:hypothetical protein OG225_40820 (plasmid) [Nocardia sp. NBC_01377]|uniref:hypothetical protein n=1 Tax=Nocardia sp. NBC_01377 TaxID=2903595 RepID=UPI002F913111
MATDIIDYQKIIRDTFDHLDRWRKAASPFVPGSGSELRGDDLDWPWEPLSETARRGLAVATDHLQAVRVHLEPEAGLPNLFPYAQSTLCRTALLGAAQAVWLLAPAAKDDRLRRHHMLIQDLIRWHHQYLRELLKHPEGDEELRANTEAVFALVNTRKQEIEAKRAALGETGKFANTAMVREAARDVFGARPNGEELVLSAVSEWRAGSGAAHGFSWQAFGGPGMDQAGSADGNGISTFTLGGTYASLANPYMTAFHMCAQGWRLLRERGR